MTPSQDSPSDSVPAIAITETVPQDDPNDTDFGDFAGNQSDEEDIEQLAEPWYNYDPQKTPPQAFYPIFLGQVLHERYRVEHKLGFGGFSTGWMAYDLQGKTDVALKVMSLGTGAENEARIHEEIKQHVSDRSHLVISLDTFLLPRDNDDHRHRVLVLPLMGPSLSWDIVSKMSMGARMSAAQQLLTAVESLHAAGIVHRDLNPSNCMWGTSKFDNVTRSAKYEVLGRPFKRVVPFVTLWKPGELVQPAVIPDNLRTDDFYLSDFGLATRLDDPTFEVQHGHPPSAWCSPERFHGKSPSFACDMWSYMVLFAQLYLEFPPFIPKFSGGIFARFVETLGPLPEAWKGFCTYPQCLDSWYDQDQKIDPKYDLASIIARRRPDADPAERELVRSIMLKVSVYSPEKRLTATQLLHDPDFRALMDKYSC